MTVSKVLRSDSAIQRTLVVLLVATSLEVGCRRNDQLGETANLDAAVKIRQAMNSGASGGGEAKAVATGTGWATLKGQFTYDGDPPQMQPYNVNKDTEACTINGKAPLQETLLVDSATKGIANIAVFVRSVSRVHDSAKATGGSVDFDQKHCVFLSHVFPLIVGDSMNIINSDPVGHNTNISGKNSFNQTIPVGQAIKFAPQKEEAAPQGVQCSIHPWMLAYLLPRENGYMAVTKEDGSFEIANLPAGEELEFQVWHESASGSNKSLVLDTPDAKKLKWSSKGRFTLMLEENETHEMNLTVAPSAFKL